MPENKNSIIFQGEVYTRGDFKSFDRVLKYKQRDYSNRVDASQRYNQLNRELYNARANYHYYLKKTNKTDKQFRKMEYSLRKIERLKLEKEEAKKEKYLKDIQLYEKQKDEYISKELELEHDVKVLDVKERVERMDGQKYD